jgi:hypothetical protein
MQDKSFQQALQEMQGRMVGGFQYAVYHMLQYRTTVTEATSGIRDEKMRGVVRKILIVGQIIVLLMVMKEMRIINEVQYDEFTAYLKHSLSYELHDLPFDMRKFAFVPWDTFRHSA